MSMYGTSVDMPIEVWEAIAAEGGWPGAEPQPWAGGILVVTPSIDDAEAVLALAYLFAELGRECGAYIL